MSYKHAFVLSWVLIGALIAGYAIAQSGRGPDGLPGCIYNSTPPSLNSGQSATLQCDSSGRLKVG